MRMGMQQKKMELKIGGFRKGNSFQIHQFSILQNLLDLAHEIY